MTCACANQWMPDDSQPPHNCDKDRRHLPPCQCRCGNIRTDDLPVIYADGKDVIVELAGRPVVIKPGPPPDDLPRMIVGDLDLLRANGITPVRQSGTCSVCGHAIHLAPHDGYWEHDESELVACEGDVPPGSKATP